MAPVADPKFRQASDQVVRLNGWEPDNEFPIGPMGNKAKRIFVCPSPAPHRFLIGGHRYLFKEPDGRSIQQIWSEVLAYEFARCVGVRVPPAFLATAPRNGSPGVLIEFFYGYVDQEPTRLIHGVERLQAHGYPINHKRGSLKDNIEVCRFQRVHDSRFWWAETLALDAMIANTDRHSENWGFLAVTERDRSVTFSMAPAYDNGTSLGYLLPEAELARRTEPDAVKKYISNGKHHFGWISGDHASAQHIRLCKVYASHVRGTAETMKRVANINNAQIDDILSWCRSFDYSVPFSANRALFVAAQLRARRDALLAALLQESAMDQWVEVPPAPLELTLSWRAPEQIESRTRWAVGILSISGPTPSFRYLEGDEFRGANLGRSESQLMALGYRGYPAFDSRLSKNRLFTEGVVEAFLRRLPPASRSDFRAFLELFRYRGGNLPPMSLLALTAARLPSDGFALIDRLDPFSNACDTVLEVAGYRHQTPEARELPDGVELSLVPEPDNQFDPDAVVIKAGAMKIGYIDRLQARSIRTWLATRAVSCLLLRKNGRAHSPAAYALLRMRLREELLAA